MENVRTILCDLPAGVMGYTLRKDDYYTIVLNSRLSHSQNKKTYDHEMSHITNCDFDSKMSSGMVELIARRRNN